MVREWLRLMANENVSPEQLDFHKTQVKLTALVERFRNSIQKWRGEYDFSHEVKAAMDTCLACKACANHARLKLMYQVSVQNFSISTTVVICVRPKIILWQI